MKIIHVNFSGVKGGAAIAASRLNIALQKQGIDSDLWCAREAGHISDIHCVKSRSWQKLDSLKNVLSQRMLLWLRHADSRSINIFPSHLVRQLNASDADIIHLHWVNAEMVGVEQLAKIRMPVVWTLHDMWPFCGAEHYATDIRYASGYQRAKDGGERAEVDGRRTEDYAKTASGNEISDSNAEYRMPNARFDLDRWMFRRKQRAWKNWQPHIVTCSNWLGDCARQSVLFKNLSVSPIHNCLDLDVFKPLNRKAELRGKYGVPVNKKVILFGAFSVTDVRKGGDLLEQALEQLNNKSDYILAVFGTTNVDPQISGIDALALGSISGDEALAEIYNLADIMCVPSRQDNLPNTAVEASASGLPVVAFRIGGLSDIVDHESTGYLADPFDMSELACGIEWTCTDEKNDLLGQRAREKAINCFSPETVVEQYKRIYRELLSRI